MISLKKMNKPLLTQIALTLVCVAMLFYVLIDKASVNAQSTDGPSILEQQQQEVRQIMNQSLPGTVELENKEIAENEAVVWDKFFNTQKSPKVLQGLGSGIIVRRDENIIYILTNGHVVGESSEVTVSLNNQRRYKGVIIGKEKRLDLALIKAKIQSDDKIRALPLGNSDDLFVGDTVIAIGTPFGFESTVTMGVVSAIGRRQAPQGNISDFIQTDAAINQGNSGGALLNIYGEVVAINTWISTPTGGSIGLGFSLPINHTKRFINSIIESGSIQYAWLGIQIRELNYEQLDKLELKLNSAPYISQIFTNSPADKANLKLGDLILRINDKQVKNDNQLILAVGEKEPGTNVKLEIFRDNEIIIKEVKLELREQNTSIESLTQLWPGFEILENEGQITISNVTPKTAAQDSNLHQGDIITQINAQDINSVVDFYSRFEDSFAESQSVELTIKRKDEVSTITVTKPTA